MKYVLTIVRDVQILNASQYVRTYVVYLTALTVLSKQNSIK